jgi:acetyl esterase/lipase
LSIKEFRVLDERTLREVRRFNQKLALLPRFRIRNRVMPVIIQSLLRISQIGGVVKLAKHGLRAERKVVGVEGASVAVRIIRPLGETKGVVLDFHGGGWVIGNAQMNDDFNIAMVNECEVTVVSIDYRLALWTPIEGLMDDCLAATRWLLRDDLEEFKNKPIIVVGESAGAHLAAATLLRLKAWTDLFRRVTSVILYYGVYDLTGTPSVRKAGRETLVLDGPGMVDALRLLTPGKSDEERRRPPLSPLYGDFNEFPSALMYVGELDPLRDDTLELASRWQMSADVEVHLLPESPHGFIHFPTAMAGQVLANSHEWIRNRIGVINRL